MSNSVKPAGQIAGMPASPPQGMDEVMSIRLPFAGFYNSIHDLMFDDALDEINQDGDVITNDMVKWQEARLEYAQAYVRKFAEATGLGLRFDCMKSPQYYNADTDRIYVNVTRGALAEYQQNLSSRPGADEALSSRVEETLSSRAGFIPYYSNDIQDWGDVGEWGEAQLGLLMGHFGEQADFDEQAIAEDLSDLADELIWKHLRNPSTVPGHVDYIEPSETPSI